MILIILYILLLISYIINSNNKRITWHQCNKSLKNNDLFKTSLNINKINFTSNDDWNILLPCNHSYNIKRYNITNKQGILPFIPNNMILGSKKQLWLTLEKYYNRQNAKKLMPESFVFPKDLNLFEKSFNGEKYMLKKEKQRQEGLKLSNSYSEIINSHDNGYKIVQKYLKNPLTYNGYKLNFRIYLVITILDNKLCAYIYDDGIISYSKDKINSNTTFDNGISSFYSSKDKYDLNYPITIKKYIKIANINWNLIFNKIKNNANKVIVASETKILPYANNNCFQLFGMDYHVDTQNNVKLLEINIGPGMTHYNNIDKNMRLSVYNNIIHLLNLSNEKHKFIQIF